MMKTAIYVPYPVGSCPHCDGRQGELKKTGKRYTTPDGKPMLPVWLKCTSCGRYHWANIPDEDGIQAHE